MLQGTESRHPRIIGPYGEEIGIEDLPPTNTTRWVIRRKAIVIAAVRGGLISLDEACRRYALTAEEYVSWERAIDAHGLPGLRATRLQYYRNSNGDISKQ